MFTNDPHQMTTIHDALSAGLNIKWLLVELQMDEQTFRDYLEYDKFTPSERKIINKVINDWEDLK